MADKINKEIYGEWLPKTSITVEQRDRWTDAKERSGATTLASWVRGHLDAAADYDMREPKKEAYKRKHKRRKYTRRY